MVRDVRVHLLPALFEPEELRGGVAVVIDVLRASTVIVHALAHGAKCVIPTLTVDEARETASTSRVRDASERPGHFLLGGERDGLLIPGFDLDNNPFAYTTEVVKDKTIVFTTTNGTAALHRAALADRVLIGALVNLQAVANVLSKTQRPIHIVCAGTKGKITAEDALCAGAIVERLAALDDVSPRDWPDDQLQLAWRAYTSVSGTLPSVPDTFSSSTDAAPLSRTLGSVPDTLRDALRHSDGGRNCLRLGFNDQIDRAATLDLFDIVPEYEQRTGRIVRG